MLALLEEEPTVPSVSVARLLSLGGGTAAACWLLTSLLSRLISSSKSSMYLRGSQSSVAKCHREKRRNILLADFDLSIPPGISALGVLAGLPAVLAWLPA